MQITGIAAKNLHRSTSRRRDYGIQKSCGKSWPWAHFLCGCAWSSVLIMPVRFAEIWLILMLMLMLWEENYWQSKVVKAYNRLYHHVSVVKMVRKHNFDHFIWSSNEETAIRGCWPSQNRPGRFGQVLQMQDQTTPLCSSRRADRKTYMVRPVRSPDELIMIFGSCSALDTQQNRLDRFGYRRTSQAGSRTSYAGLPDGSSREAFPGFCGIRRDLDRSNHSLDWFTRS
jgi:hypothetical protein